METTSKKPTKSHLICFVLSQHRDALTREEVMRQVHVLEGKRGPFKPTSNNSYWEITLDHSGRTNSVRIKGLVEVVGKKGHSSTYGLTKAGKLHASKYVSWKA